MRELESTFYAGLPVILDDEMALIEESNIFSEGRRISSVEVGNAFVIANPKVQKIIEHDQDTWLDYEFKPGEFIKQEHAPTYMEGISYGYTSVIRIFASVYYLRGHRNSLVDFVEMSDDSDQFPRISEDDVHMIKTFRFGDLDSEFDAEVIDFNLRNGEKEIDSTTMLAPLDYDVYTGVSENFDSLSTQDLDCLILDFDSEEEKEAFYKGFYHGVSNAVEMFYLLAQSRLFRESFDQEFQDGFDKITK